MRNYRINEAGQEGRVYEVSHELGSLGYGAAGNTGSRYGKSPLVKKEAVVPGGPRVVFEAEEVAAYETVGGGTEGEGEAEEVVGEAAGGSVKDVGEHYVHGVLGADGAGAQHGEAELHGEDKVS